MRHGLVLYRAVEKPESREDGITVGEHDLYSKLKDVCEGAC